MLRKFNFVLLLRHYKVIILKDYEHRYPMAFFSGMIVKRSILLLLVVLALDAYGQNRQPQNLPLYDRKDYHFGFTIGLNSMDFLVRPVENLIGLDSVYIIQPQNQGGFFVGIVSDMRINDNLNVRFVPGLLFGDRNLNYSIRVKNAVVADFRKNVESTFLEFPLYLKYKSDRIMDGNYRAYLLGGVKYSLDLASQSKKQEDNTEVLLKLKRDDIVLEIGTGFDFYMDYFKLGVELRYSWGVRNMLKKEDNIFTDSVHRLSSKVFSIGLTFE